MILFLAFCFTFLLAYTNGANDNFKAVATLYGSRLLSYRTAVWVSSLATLVGSVFAFYWAEELIVLFQGEGIFSSNGFLTPVFFLCPIAGAVSTLMVATWLALPVSTGHAILGALVGSAVSPAPAGIEWGFVTNRFLLPFVLSPLVALVLAAAVYPFVRRYKEKNVAGTAVCRCTASACYFTATKDATGFVFKNVADGSPPCASGIQALNSSRPLSRFFNTSHFLSAVFLSFARGVSDAPKIAGILLAAVAIDGLIAADQALLLVALAMALGGLLHSRRMAVTLSQDITKINNTGGMVANLVSSSLLLATSSMGLAVSASHVSVGSLFGIGKSAGRLNKASLHKIVGAWVFTLPLAGLISAGCLFLTGAL